MSNKGEDEVRNAQRELLASLQSHYDKAIREQFPEIKWNEPVFINVLSDVQGWGCRLCIARLGLRASEVRQSSAFFNTQQDWKTHFEKVHHG